MCVRVSTHLSQVTYLSAVSTCRSLECAVCFLVSFLSTTQTCSKCSFLAFALAIANALGDPVSWCLCVSTSTCLCQVSSFPTCVARLIFVPAIVSLMCLASTVLALHTCQYNADVLGCGEIFFELRLNVLPCHRCSQPRVVLQALDDNVVTIRGSSAAQELASSVTFVGASRPSWPTRATRLGTASRPPNCIGTSVKLVAPESRPDLSRSLAHVHVPFFVASSHTITLARPAVFAASTTFCPLILGASVTTSTTTSAAVWFVVPAKNVKHHRGRVALLC